MLLGLFRQDTTHCRIRGHLHNEVRVLSEACPRCAALGSPSGRGTALLSHEAPVIRPAATCCMTIVREELNNLSGMENVDLQGEMSVKGLVAGVGLIRTRGVSLSAQLSRRGTVQPWPCGTRRQSGTGVVFKTTTPIRGFESSVVSHLAWRAKTLIG